VYFVVILLLTRIAFNSSIQNFMEKVGDYIADICYLACTRHVKLEAAFINAALAVEIMEGTASALYPDMRVQRVALPLVVKAEMMHRLGFR
jgi:aarF domain-containing kinase